MQRKSIAVFALVALAFFVHFLTTGCTSNRQATDETEQDAMLTSESDAGASSPFAAATGAQLGMDEGANMEPQPEPEPTVAANGTDASKDPTKAKATGTGTTGASGSPTATR